MLNEGPLSGGIALMHRANLWNRDVRFIDNDEEIFWEIIKETVRSASRFAAIDMSRVILNA